jgi:hypothetical protein
MYLPCNKVSNTDCRPYQHDIPPTGKIFVACLPVVLCIIALVILYFAGQKFNWYSVGPTFAGANDMCSDWMLLVLIEPSSPWMIFWIALSSMVLSTAFSLAIAFWFVKKTDSNNESNSSSAKSAYIVLLCLTSSTDNLEEDEQYKHTCLPLVKKLHWFNYINILLIEDLPMAVVQIILYINTTSGTQVVDKIIMAEVMLCKLFSCAKATHVLWSHSFVGRQPFSPLSTLPSSFGEVAADTAITTSPFLGVPSMKQKICEVFLSNQLKPFLS